MNRDLRDLYIWALRIPREHRVFDIRWCDDCYGIWVTSENANEYMYSAFLPELVKNIYAPEALLTMQAPCKRQNSV